VTVSRVNSDNSSELLNGGYLNQEDSPNSSGFTKICEEAGTDSEN